MEKKAKNSMIKGGRELRLGYTTGSCATAAATAAVTMLFTQYPLCHISVILPQGEKVTFEIKDSIVGPLKASCAVIKDAGDDPDVTDGIAIVATCQLCEEGITLHAGKGVGTVRAEGLAVPQGSPAINPVPHKMIIENVRRVCEQFDYTGGVQVTIGAKGGETIAAKTFNPRLGIEGGISILGTTGRVEPMSERAIVDTIALLMDKQHIQDTERILLTPGNYGRTFSQNVLGMDMERAVKYGNYLGETLDYAVYKKFSHVLLVGHLGKLVKVAGGIMNTHSSMGDCRMEILAAHAACAGADTATVQDIMQCRTTDAALTILSLHGLDTAVFTSLLSKIQFYVQERVRGTLAIDIIVFSGESIVMKSAGADEAVHYFMRKEL